MQWPPTVLWWDWPWIHEYFWLYTCIIYNFLCHKRSYLIKSRNNWNWPWGTWFWEKVIQSCRLLNHLPLNKNWLRIDFSYKCASSFLTQVFGAWSCRFFWCKWGFISQYNYSKNNSSNTQTPPALHIIEILYLDHNGLERWNQLPMKSCSKIIQQS